MEKRNHWRRIPFALVGGAILHVLYAENDKTLAGVAAFLSDPRGRSRATLSAMMTTPHLGEKLGRIPSSPTARELLNKSDNEGRACFPTAMSISSACTAILSLPGDTALRLADLDPRGGARNLTTLYLVVPPSDISRTKPFIRLVLPIRSVAG